MTAIAGILDDEKVGNVQKTIKSLNFEIALCVPHITSQVPLPNIDESFAALVKMERFEQQYAPTDDQRRAFLNDFKAELKPEWANQVTATLQKIGSGSFDLNDAWKEIQDEVTSPIYSLLRDNGYRGGDWTF